MKVHIVLYYIINYIQIQCILYIDCDTISMSIILNNTEIELYCNKINIIIIIIVILMYNMI